MSDLMSEVRAFVEAKRAAQQRYLELIAGLSDEQLQALIAAATPEAVATVDAINRKAMDEMEKHPLAEHLGKELAADVGDAFDKLNDRVWQMLDGDNKSRRLQQVQSIITAPQVVLMFGETLNTDEQNHALAPWRQALGKAAGI